MVKPVRPLEAARPVSTSGIKKWGSDPIFLIVKLSSNSVKSVAYPFAVVKELSYMII
jgi:hypothetical protein